MSVFKRIGTQRHKYKMEFFIKKVTFSKTLKGSVYITIKRGDHKATTEQEVPFQDKVCNFKNQILSFPALTLFYDQSEQKYQQKEGEIRVILKSNKGEKKLLGIIKFDAATYANDKSTKTFKQKLQLTETPKSLEGTLSFQVYMEYIGQASQTTKSIVKEEKNNHREQSPFNKIANFFSGLVGSDENNNSPKQKQEKEDRNKLSRKQKATNDQDQQNSRNEEKHTQGHRKRKERGSSNEQNDQQDRKERGRGRNIKTTSDQQSELFNYKRRTPPRKEAPKKETSKRDVKMRNNQQQYQGSDGQQQQSKINKIDKEKEKEKQRQKQRERQREKEEIEREKERQRQIQKQKQKQKEKEKDKHRKRDREKDKDKLKQKNKQEDQDDEDINIVKVNSRQHKNLVHQNIQDSLTQFDTRQVTNSTHAKSENRFKIEEKAEFFFDDPNTFPEDFKQPQDKKDQRQISYKDDKAQKYQIAKPGKKIKENSLNVEPKKVKQSSQKNIIEVENQQKMYGVGIPSKLKNEKKVNQIQLVQPSAQNKTKKTDSQSKNQTKQQKEMLFSQFAPSNPKQTYVSPFQLNKKPYIPVPEPMKQPKKQKTDQEIYKKFTQLEKNSRTEIQKLKKQLDYKGKELETKIKQLQKYKLKNQSQQELNLKLKQSQSRRNQLQKSYGQLKQQVARSQKEISRLKSQNSTLKQQADKNESFFRQTEQHYQQTNQIDYKEQIKRLQKQKNQHLLTLQKEREKNKKEVKQLTQQIEKAKQQFKQYEDLSKAELKKLKDQVMLKNGNIQNFKDKLKQKSKEQEALLRENKQLNSANIDLKQKLQGLKIKICEKLNEANQSGESYLMEILTELNEQI